MHPLPHVYTAVADGARAGSVELTSGRLSALPVEPPPEFGGPGQQWSPEGLLCAAAASCFILSFRAVARAARLEWQKLECKVDGTLQRENGILRFTRLVITATLIVDSEQDIAKHRRALDQAERGCLIANSLSASRELRADVVYSATQRPAFKVAKAG
jgi:peroxiredoxin-like protein